MFNAHQSLMPAALLAVPILISAIALVATFKGGSARFAIVRIWASGFLALVLFTASSERLLFKVNLANSNHDTYFISGKFYDLTVLGMISAFFTALYFISPTISKRETPKMGGIIHFLIFFAGAILTLSPWRILHATAPSRRYLEYTSHFAHVEAVSSAGIVIILASFAFFIGLIIWAMKYGRS